MIRDLSETLQAILDDPLLGKQQPFQKLVEAQVAFERPSEQFNPSQTTLNLFLFDIRENVELRDKEPVVARGGDGKASIRRPPLRVDCSYLLTAWAVGSTGPERVLEEHELLGMALQVLARYPTIEERFLRGSLKQQGRPMPLRVGGIDREEMKDTAGFWTALGNKLRPALVVTATLELLTSTQADEAPLVTQGRLRLGLREAAGRPGLVEKTAEEAP